jgi:hypothetical protein
MSLEAICSNIITHFTDFKPDVIYLAIGCFMGHYQDINPSNNQQNPLFLQPFAEKKKMYIFFDPALETPLKLESQIDLVETDSGDEYRVLENDNLIVFAIKKSFYFYGKKDDTAEMQMTFGIQKNLLATILMYATENKIKAFVQDYTGADINDAYMEFFELFPKEDLYKHVIFDITQNEGGCFVDFSKSIVHYDSKGDFIQTKFLTLSEMKKIDPDMFKASFHKRVGWINYHVSRQIRIINKEIEGNQYDIMHVEHILKNLATTYSVTSEISIENLENTITHVVIDIVEALELPRDILKHISDNKYNQKVITDIFSPIKSLVGY